MTTQDPGFLGWFCPRRRARLSAAQIGVALRPPVPIRLLEVSHVFASEAAERIWSSALHWHRVLEQLRQVRKRRGTFSLVPVPACVYVCVLGVWCPGALVPWYPGAWHRHPATPSRSPGASAAAATAGRPPWRCCMSRHAAWSSERLKNDVESHESSFP